MTTCFSARAEWAFACLALSISVLITELRAQSSPPEGIPSCAPNAIACVRADFDGDGRNDKAEVLRQDFVGMYGLSISLQNGDHFGPLMGSYEPARDRISLAIRRGTGDLRCRNWRPGTGCGFPLQRGGLGQALYLSHSREGDFVISFGFPHSAGATAGSGAPQSLRFVVIPALDGPATRDP